MHHLQCDRYPTETKNNHIHDIVQNIGKGTYADHFDYPITQFYSIEIFSKYLLDKRDSKTDSPPEFQSRWLDKIR